MDPISIAPLQPAQPLTTPVNLRAKSAEGESGNFMQMLGKIGKDVSRSQKLANEQVEALASGKTDNIHQVMLSLGKAELSFNYMMEVRNRLVEAYKEVMRIQV